MNDKLKIWGGRALAVIAFSPQILFMLRYPETAQALQALFDAIGVPPAAGQAVMFGVAGRMLEKAKPQ